MSDEKREITFEEFKNTPCNECNHAICDQKSCVDWQSLPRVGEVKILSLADWKVNNIPDCVACPKGHEERKHCTEGNCHFYQIYANPSKLRAWRIPEEVPVGAMIKSKNRATGVQIIMAAHTKGLSTHGMPSSYPYQWCADNCLYRYRHDEPWQECGVWE